MDVHTVFLWAEEKRPGISSPKLLGQHGRTCKQTLIWERAWDKGMETLEAGKEATSHEWPRCLSL